MISRPVAPEDTFTAPHADCANPGLWHATDAQSTELEVTELVAAFVRALQPEYCLETGSCWGSTAQAIGLALQRNGHGWLDTLEPEPERAAYAQQRCAGLPVVVHQTASLGFTPEGPIGFAWLDSLLELRVPEFWHLRPWMQAGTVVGFHDTSPHMGVYGSHVELLHGARVIRLRTPRGVTFAEILED